MMEPLVRFELTTVRLQGGCSTTELKRHSNEVPISTEDGPLWQAENGSAGMDVSILAIHNASGVKQGALFQRRIGWRFLQMGGCFRMQRFRGGGAFRAFRCCGRSGCLFLRFLISGSGRRHDAGDAFHRMPGNDISLGSAVLDSQVREVEGPDQVTEFQNGF